MKWNSPMRIECDGWVLTLAFDWRVVITSPRPKRVIMGEDGLPHTVTSDPLKFTMDGAELADFAECLKVFANRAMRLAAERNAERALHDGV